MTNNKILKRNRSIHNKQKPYLLQSFADGKEWVGVDISNRFQVSDRQRMTGRGSEKINKLASNSLRSEIDKGNIDYLQNN